ncbi:MAG: phosphocholine cytidylyltransferase family protein [Gemmatimonadota bacterium]|nr:phosphocholine cytidylyltransferase family protein [Gemmatimonadota bacterium]
MKAIILAAGLGSRLGPKAKGLPKALQKVGDRTLIEHQLEALSAEGVGPVVGVVGHGEGHVRTVLGDSVEYVVNSRPSETNSLYSLWLARQWLEGEVLILNSDLFFHPDILKRLLRTKGSALAFDSTSHGGAEQTKVGLNGGRITDLGKDFPETGARGENLGLIKFDAQASMTMRKRAEAIISSGGERTWVTEAVRSVLAEVEVTGVNVAGLPWVEIDFPYDLDAARRQVWPEIQRSRHPGRRFLYRMRTPLSLGAVAAVLITVWGLSAEVGPASIDWESIPPDSAERVKLKRVANGSQKWWIVEPGRTVTVEVDGDYPVRLEARPLLPENRADTVAYVLELTVDGEPVHYEAHRAQPDPEVSLAGWTVGSRDREVHTLPPGPHLIGVKFLAGRAGAVLVRVRQPE